MGNPLDLKVFYQVENSLDVDSGRGQEHFTKRFIIASRLVIQIKLQFFQNDLSGQRKTIGM